MFKINNKVIIEASDKWFISGIHGYDSLDILLDKFGNYIRCRTISKCWSSKLIGTIVCIGNYNSYIIKSDDGKYYNFSNQYDEMRLNDE